MNQDSTSPQKRDGRKENAATTQLALCAAGRRLFASQGYEATSVGALCAEAGVTSGALYHHYGDKKRLFAAVAENLECELVELASHAHLATLAAGGNGWDGFLSGVDALLTAGIDPGIRRIGLTDAPAVLGAAGWQAIRERHGHGALSHAIQGLQAQALLLPGDPKRLAWLVLGMVYSAIQALPEDPAAVDAALADTRMLMRAMLQGLRNAPVKEPRKS